MPDGTQSYSPDHREDAQQLLPFANHPSPTLESHTMLKLSMIVLPAFLVALIAASLHAAPPVPDSVVWQEAIEYSNPGDEHLQLNLARPKTGDGPFPTIHCIHGGGFRAGKRESYDGLCVKLAERGYVAGVAERVLVFARKERPGITWTVRVIDEPKTINAFATPGGYLYVYTGLLLLAENEAELAGVMGHESGHVVARHSARNMIDSYGLQAVAALALGKNPGLLAELAATVAAGGALLAHSRTDEDEADEFGARYASMASYDPHGLVTFFDRLRAKVGDTSGITTWLSDHPSTADRIGHINAFIIDRELYGKDLGLTRFNPIQQRIAARVIPKK